MPQWTGRGSAVLWCAVVAENICFIASSVPRGEVGLEASLLRASLHGDRRLNANFQRRHQPGVLHAAMMLMNRMASVARSPTDLASDQKLSMWNFSLLNKSLVLYT